MDPVEIARSLGSGVFGSAAASRGRAERSSLIRVRISVTSGSDEGSGVVMSDGSSISTGGCFDLAARRRMRANANRIKAMAAQSSGLYNHSKSLCSGCGTGGGLMANGAWTCGGFGGATEGAGGGSGCVAGGEEADDCSAGADSVEADSVGADPAGVDSAEADPAGVGSGVACGMLPCGTISCNGWVGIGNGGGRDSVAGGGKDAAIGGGADSADGGEEDAAIGGDADSVAGGGGGSATGGVDTGTGGGADSVAGGKDSGSDAVTGGVGWDCVEADSGGANGGVGIGPGSS